MATPELRVITATVRPTRLAHPLIVLDDQNPGGRMHERQLATVDETNVSSSGDLQGLRRSFS
jgi:hypothetical protein